MPMPSLVLAALVTALQPPAELLDAYLDARFERSATDELVRRLRAAKLDCAGVEALLRAGRSSYPEPPQPPGKLSGPLPLPCDHVDHETAYLIHVPSGYDRTKATPLVVVGHGGSIGRDLAFGERAARAGIEPMWRTCSEREGFLLLAPLTDRGWGAIGNSILLSAISRVQRDYHVDPDRVYVTGHSMGGHMTWRSAITMPDRFAAVSPMSGGYDYVKNAQVHTCINVPGYATCGSNEPYQIREFNQIIREWMAEHDFPWILREKSGGHTIFPDEVPRVAAFFAEHPRDLYRRYVYARGAGVLAWRKADTHQGWPRQHTWNEERPIPHATFHWLRLEPLPEDTPQDQRVQVVQAQLVGDNTIEVTAQHARALRVYLHPKMVDFATPVRVVVNGEKVFDRKVEPDLAGMLDLVREFDDRGRVFWASIRVPVTTSRAVPAPRGG